MNCPNCNFEQPLSKECIKCGIVFDKYSRRTQVKPSETKTDLSPVMTNRKQSGNKTWLSLIVISVISCLAIFLFFGKKPDQRTTGDNASNLSSASDYDQTSSESPIQKAASSIVIVKTKWSKGYGCFIDNDGHVLTSKTLVSYKTKNPRDPVLLEISRINGKISDNQRRIDFFKKKLDFERLPLNTVKDYEHQMEEMTLEIESLQEQLNEINDHPQIFFPDGSELSFIDISIHDDFDVALIKVSGPSDITYLKPLMSWPDLMYMKRIEKEQESVYMFGNELDKEKVLNFKCKCLYSNKITRDMYCVFYEKNRTIIPVGSPLINKKGEILGICVNFLYKGEVRPILSILDEFNGEISID